MPDPTIPPPTPQDRELNLPGVYALAEAAKADPWVTSTTQDGADFIVMSEAEPPGQNGICSMWSHGWPSGNLQTHEPTWRFIAAARTAIPALVRLLHAERQVRQAAEAENARLKRGDFTEEEFQNLCHNLKPDDLRRFRQGCEDYTAKLFGLKRPASEEERQRLKELYADMTEPCCECGTDYPKADLVIDGEIHCPTCRAKEVNRGR